MIDEFRIPFSSFYNFARRSHVCCRLFIKILY